MPRENVAEVVYKHGLPRSPDWVDFKTYDEFEKELSELRKKRLFLQNQRAEEQCHQELRLRFLIEKVM